MLINAGAQSQSIIAVEVHAGLQSRIDVFVSGEQSTVFETNNEDIGSWDMKQDGSGRYIFVAVRSSAPSGEPENIWSTVIEPGKKGILSKKLSSHNEWLAGNDLPITKPFYWTGSDGQSLDGIIMYPSGSDFSAPLPAVVVAHGGPYGFV